VRLLTFARAECQRNCNLSELERAINLFEVFDERERKRPR
jgi:hypothetical protein